MRAGGAARADGESTGIALFVFAAVLALTAWPPLASLRAEGELGAFRYFAADAFYYLTVADRSVDASMFTFDGIHATNGFHPLWQLYLERGFAWLGLDAAGEILFAAISGAVFVALGTALFSLVLLRLSGRTWLALLGASPGLFYLIVPRIHPHHFAQWSFANGMESPLSVGLFGALCWLLFGRRALRADGAIASWVGPSLLLTGIVLSRLDDVFLLASIVGLAWWTARSKREGLRRAVAVGALPALALAVYMAFNWVQTGSPMPSSGAAKAQPLYGLARNLYATWTTLLPFADFMREDASVWSSEAWRILQMGVPLAVASLHLLTRPIPPPHVPDRSGRDDTDATIAALAVYVVLKTGYNFTMVGLWHQGQWYYPLCLMTVNLIAVVWLSRWLDARPGAAPNAHAAPSGLAVRWPRLARIPVTSLCVGILLLLSANAYVDLKASGGHMLRSYRFFTERESATHLLEATCPGCGLLSFDDGIVAFSMRSVPTMNGLGLVLDPEGRRALDEGRLLDVAWQRGHRVLVSVNYAMPEDAYRDDARLHAYLRGNPHLENEALDDWNFEVAFSLPESGVSFVRFEPRRSAAR